MTLTPEDIAQIAALFDTQTELLRSEFATKDELHAEIGSLRHEMNTGFDGIYKKLETFEQEYLSMREQVRRTDSFDERITLLEKQVA